MIKKTARYFWSVRQQFFKYFVVGVSGFFIDIGFLALFKERFGWTPVLSVIVSQLIALSYNFTLNKYWSFKSKAMPHKQLIRYLTLVGFNYALSVLTMYIFSDHLGYNYLMVRIATIIVMVAWNFFVYKYWVYIDPSDRKQVV